MSRLRYEPGLAARALPYRWAPQSMCPFAPFRSSLQSIVNNIYLTKGPKSSSTAKRCFFGCHLENSRHERKRTKQLIPLWRRRLKAPLTSNRCEADLASDAISYRSRTKLIHYKPSISENGGHSLIITGAPQEQTYDFKNGLPKLQLYKNPPTLGGSVAAIFGIQSFTEFVYIWRAKSRGSIGNILPPI
jgi:hypothetical protein